MKLYASCQMLCSKILIDLLIVDAYSSTEGQLDDKREILQSLYTQIVGLWHSGWNFNATIQYHSAGCHSLVSAVKNSD